MLLFLLFLLFIKWMMDRYINSMLSVLVGLSVPIWNGESAGTPAELGDDMVKRRMVQMLAVMSNSEAALDLRWPVQWFNAESLSLIVFCGGMWWCHMISWIAIAWWRVIWKFKTNKFVLMGQCRMCFNAAKQEECQWMLPWCLCTLINEGEGCHLLFLVHWNSTEVHGKSSTNKQFDTPTATLKGMIQMAYELTQCDLVAQWCCLGMGDDPPELWWWKKGRSWNATG